MAGSMFAGLPKSSLRCWIGFGRRDTAQPHSDKPRNRSAEVPASGRYVALWVALGCVTAIVLLLPNLPVAIHEPRLSIAVGSVSGVIGLGLLQLALLRFRVLRRPIDLDAGLAFGVLAVRYRGGLLLRIGDRGQHMSFPKPRARRTLEPRTAGTGSIRAERWTHQSSWEGRAELRQSFGSAPLARKERLWIQYRRASRPVFSAGHLCQATDGKQTFLREHPRRDHSGRLRSTRIGIVATFAHG